MRDAHGRSALELAVERGWSRAEVALGPSAGPRRSKEHAEVARSSVDLSAAWVRSEQNSRKQESKYMYGDVFLEIAGPRQSFETSKNLKTVFGSCGAERA